MYHISVCLILVVFTYISRADVTCPPIISRSMWGAQDRTETEYITFPAKYAIIIHTAGSECTNMLACAAKVAGVQKYHMNDLGWHDIGYSFLIGGDGVVYEGTGWHKLGAHTSSYNRDAIGVALIGNFEKKIAPKVQLDAAKKLLECGLANKELAENYKLMAHSQLKQTISPGLLVAQEIQKWPHWSQKPFPKN